MSISKEIMLEMYKRMDQARKFEEKVCYFFSKGMIHGTTHLSIGQEASSVAAVMALDDGDLVSMTHRGHALSIGMGIDLNKMMAELMGKVTGYCKGKGGSMHIADLESGNLGSNGIVGGGLTLAPGAALTQKYKKTGKIVLCLYFEICLSNISIKEGNIVTVHNTPMTTPFAITIPISRPNPNSITHKAKNPANVVVELPNTDVTVFLIAFAMAVLLSSGDNSFSSSYLCNKNIE